MLVLSAVDGSESARFAARWAAENVVGPTDMLHLLAVLPPHFTPPVPKAVDTYAMSGLEEQRRVDVERADSLLAACAAECCEVVPEGRLFLSKVMAHGGASGVGESVLEEAADRRAALIVLGSRGMGAVKRSLMALIGLGSVGDYVAHNARCPVAVVPLPPAARAAAAGPAATQEGPRQVCVAVDASPAAQQALRWALARLMAPPARASLLHVVSVARSVPLPMVEDGAAAAAVLEAQRWSEAKQEALAEAAALCEAALEQAAIALGRVAASTRALEPEGGASGAGEAVCRYVRELHGDILVLGSRGLAELQRSLLPLLGLGSVSDYCGLHTKYLCSSMLARKDCAHARVHQARYAVVVVKGEAVPAAM
ncbi:hypothetical protein WJX81_001118 [Elliptochloris bilobata]|uniref:UspA domain-containing protein n=1 Tax=Elliptochloris bilobata TaxID=381761 RepID=A0AAW1S4R9_9CHLO